MEALARSRLWSRCKSRASAYYRALTRDFNYSTDFFFGQDFLMAIAGARLNSTNVRIRRWWNAYRLVSCLPVLLIYWNTFVAVRNHAKLEIVLSCVQATVGLGITVLRMMLIIWHYDSLMEVQRYKLCQKALSMASYGVGVMTVFVYLFSYTILNGLMSELRVLAQAFSVVFDNTETRVQRKLELEPANSRQHDLMKKRFFWKFVQEEFGDCVQLHIEFLALLNRIRPFLNATFLIVYYSTVISLSSGAIYVSQMENVTIFSLETLYYCVWVAFECGTLARTVSMLTESHESIGWEVYNLDWHEKLEWEEQFQEEYRSVRATMLNVMIVAQQPLRLNCYGFFEFTQDRFYELLNMAYSMFTFFRNFV
ncbi:hypothetical protein pipiens_008472 [Culex pipiens pipiens]|uniref:Odorant receptor n=1 Tax=Culex pipiens pipiens TaxID=38569 RepID=A0ABD1DHG9_CULPP